MSGPQPPSSLEGHCSAIDNETLYVLSPNSLQSLPLKDNATWSQLTNGVSVTEPACVRAVPNGDESQAALYVIGGTTSDQSYGGLQRYFFGNQSWETLSPPANVLQGRTNHSVAYLNDSSSILVYAGSQPQDETALSSQTFLITLLPPYNILSFTSSAYPRNQPVLTPWNSSHAILAGGSPWATELFTFGPDEEWQQLGTNLTQPLNSGTQGTIVDGSDGSRVLETYDLRASPNQVSQIVLLDAGGTTAATGQTIGSSSSRKRKRDLTLQNWPAYNNSDAPTVMRSDFGLAQDPSGLAVISGGSTTSPVVLFDQTGNNWVDTQQFFGDSTQQPLQSGSSSAAPASPTSSSTSTASAAAAGTSSGASSKDRMLRTLGITLGVLCGIAAIFIIVLLFMRWRKMRQKKKNEDYIDEKSGNRMSFADRGASFMKEAGGSMNNLAPPNPRYPSNNASHSSLAIMAGRFGNKSNPGHAHKVSSESTARLVKDKNGNTVGISEPLELESMNNAASTRKPVPRNEPTPPSAVVYGSSPPKEETPREKKRSSGWSKYFATSEPNNMSHIPSAYLDPHSSTSQYGSSRPSQVSRIPSSALVPPLDIDFSRTVDGQRLSHVASGSPSFSNSSEDLAKRGSTIGAAEGQSATFHGINRDELRGSGTETISSYDRSTLSSDFYNNSGSTPWTPMSNTFKDHVNNRPASSLYTASVYDQRIPSRGKSAGFFPGAGTTYRPKPGSRLGHSASPSADWAAPTLKVQPAEDRDSHITVFPRGVPSGYYADRGQVEPGRRVVEDRPTPLDKDIPGGWPEAPDATPGGPMSRSKSGRAPVTEDMSWLNLGLGGRV